MAFAQRAFTIDWQAKKAFCGLLNVEKVGMGINMPGIGDAEPQRCNCVE